MSREDRDRDRERDDDQERRRSRSRSPVSRERERDDDNPVAAEARGERYFNHARRRAARGNPTPLNTLITGAVLVSQIRTLRSRLSSLAPDTEEYSETYRSIISLVDRLRSNNERMNRDIDSRENDDADDERQSPEPTTDERPNPWDRRHDRGGPPPSAGAAATSTIKLNAPRAIDGGPIR